MTEIDFQKEYFMQNVVSNKISGGLFGIKCPHRVFYLNDNGETVCFRCKQKIKE